MGAIEQWHEVARARDAAGLEALLAEDVVFLSPVVHTPQRGKAITTKYLAAALHVLGNADFRYVGTLPDPRVPEYVELNSRLGWKISDTLSLSLSGFNLLHGHHQEYPGADQIRRSVYLETRLRF